MRKVFALCLTLVLACAWLLIPVQAEEPDGSGAPVTVVAEDFEAYELDDPLLTGLGVEFGGDNWVSNAYRMGEGDPTEAHFGISEGESGDFGRKQCARRFGRYVRRHGRGRQSVSCRRARRPQTV